MSYLRTTMFWDCDECKTRYDSSQTMMFARMTLALGEERQICYTCLNAKLPGIVAGAEAYE